MLKSFSAQTNALGALNYKGTWDATANSPALASSVGTKGDYYVVGTAGSTTLNGISNWGIGDWAVFNGSVWQRVEGGADVNAVNLTVSGNTTLSGPVSVTPTWNAGATVLSGIGLSVTDTASASTSLLMNLAVGTTFLTLRKNGLLTLKGNESEISIGYPGETNVLVQQGGLINPSNGYVAWSSSTTAVSGANRDTFLTRVGAASLRLGTIDAASPVAQTFGAQGSRAGTDSNVGGANLTIRSGNGTGTGTISTLILQTPVVVASGTGAQTQTTGLTIKAGTAVMTSYTVATLPAAATAGAGARAFVTDALAPVFGSAVAGSGAVNVPVYSDGAAWNVG